MSGSELARCELRSDILPFSNIHTQIGVIEHEIAHALGFNHEQMRHDRDTFVTYYAANVQAGMEPDNYAKLTTTTNNNYGLAYDYGSVMHYVDSESYSKKVELIKRECIDLSKKT